MDQDIRATLTELRKVRRRSGRRSLDVGDWPVIDALLDKEIGRAERRQAKVLAKAAARELDAEGEVTGRSSTPGSVGYALQPRPTFVLSPGVRYMTTELPAHGHAMVAVVPLEWMWTSGLRVVLEGGVGYAFGGEVRVAQCQTGQPCTDVISERDGGIVLQVRFGCGFGF